MTGSDIEDDDKFYFQATWNMIKRLADQISHPALAVGELIKNAYDADATEVLVNMKQSMDEKVDNCKMVIHDDGHGMTKMDIKTKWSNMGISVNQSNPFSDKGRSKQGGLGLGRFGCWKLGKKVTMATRAKDNPVFAIVIDFSEHPPDTPLEKVMTPIMTDAPAFKNLFPDGKTGTYIIVEKFNESMTSHTDLQKIQRATQSLLNPFEKDSDFKIIQQLPKRFERWEDYAIDKVIDQALYKFEVNIDTRGQTVQGTYLDNNPYSKHYQEEEIIHYKTEEILEGQKCLVKAVKVWMYHFHRGSGYRSLWPSTSYGSLSRDDYDHRLAGFRLYKDSVRVFPYGQSGNDWLQLDYMQNKQRSVDWFSNTQIVAAARFDMTANQGIITDKANREGLEDSIGQRQLFKILQQLVKRMRALVNRDYPDKAPPHLQKVEFEYGSFNSKVGSDINFSVRSLGGVINTPFRITKGEKPEWLELDSRTGNFTGTAKNAGGITLEVTAGNTQGNYTAKISISVAENPPTIVICCKICGCSPCECGEEEIVCKICGCSPCECGEEEIVCKTCGCSPCECGDEPFGLTSNLDIAISEFKRDLIILQQESNSDRKIEMLMELNSRIEQILRDEGFEA